MRNYSLKTKANSHHSRDVRKIYKRVLFVGLAFLLLFLAKNIIGTLTSFVTAPVYSIRHYINTSSETVPVYIRDRTALLEQINLLEQEIASQQGMRVTLDYLQKENDELRALVGATEVPTVTASVTARPPFSPYDTVLIDRGADDGIVSSAPVYYGSGMALGYVRVVYQHHALITLFSSPNVQSTVYVFGPDIFTTAYGEGGGVIRLSIPQGIKIAEGDLVTLPSLSGGVLGTVNSVESVPTEPEQHAYVLLDIPLQSIRTVRVSTEPQVPVSFEDALFTTEEVERTLFTVPVPPDYIATPQATTTVATTSSGVDVRNE